MPGQWDALQPGQSVIVGPDGDARTSPRSQGGTGKTQLAVAFARKLWSAGELDLLVWLDAGSRDAIVAGYARALADIRIAAPAGKPEAAATRFLTWLTTTRRRWLVVLDNLAELADADGLWPEGPSGQALVTTRLARTSSRSPTARTGRREAARQTPERLSLALASFSQREALDYLTERLDDDPYQAAGSLDLATSLGCLPVSLALAVSYLRDSRQDCRQYRMIWEQYRRAFADGLGSDLLAPTWMLAIDRATQYAPTELPWPALRLAAVLGPGWIPGAVLTSAAACAYVTGRQVVSREDQGSLRAAFGNLERVGLVAIEPEDEIRTVRIAPSVQSSVRQAMSSDELHGAVRAAADAICESWAASGSQPDLELALRACATSVRRSDDATLWNPDCHPLLIRVGQSLDEAQMAETAFIYWRDLASSYAGKFGTRTPLALQLRDRLASAALAAGRAEEAAGLRERLAADVDEIAGPAHPQAITGRLALLRAYRSAGRLPQAISLGVRLAADSERVLSASHPESTEVLAELGGAYCDAGQYAQAIGALERCLALRAETLGMLHPQTLATSDQLAEAYRHADRGTQAIGLYEAAVAQADQAVGSVHPDALAARTRLAVAYYTAGRPGDAASTLEEILTDSRRGPRVIPANTITIRSNLAAIYCLGSRAKDAIPLYESALADLGQVRGPAHPDTFRAQWNLAAAYHKARRVPEAVELGESTLAGCEQALGAGHQETLTTRANLAHAYHATGQLKRASAHFDRALRDCEYALGPDDPLTGEVQALRKRYLAGSQGAAPIVAPPVAR